MLSEIWRFEEKIENLSSSAHFVHTTAKKVVSRRRNNENDCEITRTVAFLSTVCSISDAFAVIRVAYLKLLFRVSEISSLAKCVLTILELNCHELFGDVTKKIKICQVLMWSTQPAANEVISRCGLDKNS